VKNIKAYRNADKSIFSKEMRKIMVEDLQSGRSGELTYELLRGAIDLHVHPGPHLSRGRSFSRT